MTPEEKHQHHHDLIAERVAAYHALPKRRRTPRTATAALTALDGHLRSMHGWRHTVGPPVAWARMVELHERAHREGS